MLAELERFVRPALPLTVHDPGAMLEGEPRYQRMLSLEQTYIELHLAPRLAIEQPALEQLCAKLRQAWRAFTDDELRAIQTQRLAGYPTLDPSFLSMEQTTEHQGRTLPVPRFAVFCPSRSGLTAWYRSYPLRAARDVVFSFAAEPSRDTDLLESPLGDPLRQILFQTLNLIPEMFAQVHVRFSGLIPTDAKRIILHGQMLMYAPEPYSYLSGIYLVQEVRPEAWTVSVPPPPPNPDPLIVAVSGNQCYLLGSFDTLPWESYVSREFQTNP